MSRDVFAPRPLIKRLLYLGLYNGSKLIPKTVVFFIGYWAGLLSWLTDKKGKSIVQKNLQTLMPQCSDESIQRVVRKCYVNFGLACAELILIPRLKKSHFKNTRIIDPWNQMNDIPVTGPLIGVTVHCNWEIMPCILNRLGYFKHCHAIALSHEDHVIDGMFNQIRESMGVHSLLLDRAPLETLRALKAGGILALVGDRDYTQHGVSRKIGSGYMNIPVGPAALAIQTNASILPVFTCRHGSRQFSVVFGKAIKPDPSLSKREQLPKILDELAIYYERFLQAAPSQWVCFHPAFNEDN